MSLVKFQEHPYASFLHEVEKPARYVGGEWGQVQKDWDATTARVCLAFPDLYDLGMSHLGTRILYDALNRAPDVLCERAFVPWLDMEEQLRQRELPLLSLESARALREFHVVGISLQHELVFTNVLTLLDLGGIPLRASHRTDRDPLVLGGGSVASHPEPVAAFFDAFVIGDGERVAIEVVRRWVEDQELSRLERLKRLASLQGVYVPSLYDCRHDPVTDRVVVDRPSYPEAPLPVQRAFIENLDAFPFPESFPTGGPEAVFERLSIEIARGCMQGCRFCQAGMIFRPERERHPVGLIETVERSLAKSGQDEVSLTSLSPADYSCIGPLFRVLSRRTAEDRVSLGVSSLRAYGVDDETFEAIRRVRATGLTLAPEAGTQRMRDVVNKNVTDEQLVATVERTLGGGWDRAKLYFMIGLPTETSEDVRGIVELTARARDAARRVRKRGRPPQVTASVSTFVPKPHTPFQWAAMDSLDSVGQKHDLLHAEKRSRKVELKTHGARASILEGVLSRGDRRLADVIERSWRQGARFDAWDGHVEWEAWLTAFDACDLTMEAYLAELPIEGTLPWAHIDVGLELGFLKRERTRALKARPSPPCGRSEGAPPPPLPLVATPSSAKAQSTGGPPVCYHCGVGCDLDAMQAQRESAQQSLAAPSGTAGADEEQEKPKGPRDEKNRATRYRLRFEKLGRSYLIGHLDLVREVPRVLRRAGLSLWYSQGFHPKPVMTFGPALSLGVASFDEYVDIKTCDDFVTDGLVARLNDSCPDGLRFLSVELLEPTEPAISKLVREAQWLVGLPTDWVRAQGGAEWLAQRVTAVFQRDRIDVVREGKRGTRTVDVRDTLVSLGVAEPEESTRQFDRAGIPGAWSGIESVVHLGGPPPIRLKELVKSVTESESTPFRAIRVACRRSPKPKPQSPTA